MQADYTILPKRNGKTDGTFKNLQPVKFFTNYYDIQIDQKKSLIYQYSFLLDETIPKDSSIYQYSIQSIKKTLKQRIGYLIHSGQMIWGDKKVHLPATLICKFTHEEKPYELQATLKLTKQLDLKDLDVKETRSQYQQILNVSLKNTLREKQFCQLGKRGVYFQKKITGSQQLSQYYLNVIKGFRFTLTRLNSGFYLQIDYCTRVLQAKNLLQLFNGQSLDYNRNKYINTIVLAKYGNYRTYKIEEIDIKKTPQSTFLHQGKGKEMSYIEYYHEVYGIKITNNRQNLLKAVKSVKKQLDKGGKQYKQIKQYVYLVPQLVCPTGMTDEQRENRDAMKQLAPFTKLSPVQRVNLCKNVIEEINQTNGLIKIKNAKRLQGYTLNRPDLLYSGATKIQPDNRGNIKHRGVLKEPFHFTDWLFVYSRKSGNDDDEADKCVELLKKSGESYGIKFKEPGFVTIESFKAQAWMAEIQEDIKKNGVPQIIVCFLNRNQERIYGQLKRFITNQIKCTSQFIRRRTVGNPKGAMSAASKIGIQMNIKVGAVPWQVQKRNDYFKNRNVMYGALSISKGKKGNTLAFVGTINNQCTRVFSDCKVGIKDKQNIPVSMLEEIFVNWAKSYFQTNNKKVPDLIILYRQGLSIPQTRTQLPRMQIPALQGMIKIIGDKTKTKNYNPQIVIMTVNKKINTRYFSIDKQNLQNPNKFVPELSNPDSGSVMVESLSTDNMYDFHLAAQYVTQGTCTPTLFRVAYDTSKIPQQALISFTFEQCFNYYNWEGAVRVPACLQCADKLSKLVGQYIQDGIVDSPVTKKHFFL